jgi:hypothetical protein
MAKGRSSAVIRFIRLSSAVAVVIVAILSLSATLRSPTVSKRGDTAAAVRLRTIAAAQVLFATACGNGGYATTFEQLATPAPGSSDGFTSEPRAGERQDHTFRLIPADASGPRDCNGQQTAMSFTATAVPVSETTGKWSFTLSRDGEIWYAMSPVAPREPFAPKAKKFQ